MRPICVIEISMPYKANAERRYKIPKARYRVTNWPPMMRLWSGGEA
jgi:hypothetical protein